MSEIVRSISGRFNIRKEIIYKIINFNGRCIRQDRDGKIEMDMSDYVDAIKFIDIQRSSRKNHEDTAWKQEFDLYRSLAG